MKHIKIFGHFSPDTDSTCAPIIWAWYLNERQGQTALPYLLGEPNNEANFVLERWNIEKPQILKKVAKDDAVIIVDTNNPKELPENINDAHILEIIDHHKLIGGLQTSTPINITIRPLACTTTVMYQLMDIDTRENLPDQIAALMLSAIISDTLEFRSPTTTDTDKEIAEILAKQLSIDITEHATEMFDAKSDVSQFSDMELIRMDSKKFKLNGKNFRVSVLETTTPETILERKSSILKNMKTVCEEDKIDEVLLFVVDILKEESTLLVANEFTKSIAEKSFDVSVKDNQVVLSGVVSRKKQIIPALES